MTRQQLETLARSVIDALRRGERVEDDLVECKRDWPDPGKARQLAGSANHAAGAPIVWIIGVDEDTGAIHPRSRDDPANWWAQVSKRFDQTPPDLLDHLVVYLGDDETVVALAFGTDRAPYLVTTSGGSPEREVPVRDGTRTRSAHRHELLRMFVPAAAVPPAVILRADFSAAWHAATGPRDHLPGREESTVLTGEMRVFLEHVSGGVVMLPVHQMQAKLSSEGLALPLRASVHGPTPSQHGSPPSAPPPQFGVTSTHEGVICTGPGGFTVRFSKTDSGDRRHQWGQVSAWRLDAMFGVVGGSRPIRRTVLLRRRTSFNAAMASESEFFAEVGHWSLADDGKASAS